VIPAVTSWPLADGAATSIRASENTKRHVADLTVWLINLTESSNSNLAECADKAPTPIYSEELYSTQFSLSRRKFKCIDNGCQGTKKLYSGSSPLYSTTHSSIARRTGWETAASAMLAGL
jgi:hypothetical protein